MTNPKLKYPTATVNSLSDLEPVRDPWRTMTAQDALAFLLAEDAAQRTLDAHELRLGGFSNRRRLRAWRRENGLCPKCGTATPADKPKFKHCQKCRDAMSEQQRRFNANLTEPLRLARNERARRSYHKITHGKPPPELVMRRRMVTEVVTPVIPVVTEVVTPAAPPTQEQIAAGPKRDRAEYMRRLSSC